TLAKAAANLEKAQADGPPAAGGAGAGASAAGVAAAGAGLRVTAAAVKEIQDLGGDAIGQTRSLTMDLSPPALTLGLAAGIEWLAEQNRRLGLDVRISLPPRPQAVADDVKILLFQAVRELLTNIIKHARAKCVGVTVRQQG